MSCFDQQLDRTRYDAIKCIVQKEQQQGCLPLWIADMDFPAASAIQEALKKRIEFPIYGYTQRTPRYYDAIQGWMKRRHRWNIEASWISTNPGVVPTIAFTFRTFLKPGDKVIVQPPVYPPFYKMIASSGGEIVTNPLKLVEGHYQMDFDCLERQARDPRVKLLLLCNPHNPVGRVWTEQELRTLAEICIANDVLIFSDDIHHDLVFEGFRYTPIASLSQDISMHTITATAPSKTFNLGGFKMGNIIIENPELRDKYKAYVEGLWLHHMDPAAIESTIAAYNHGEAWFSQALSYIQDNCRFVDEFIAQRLPQLRTYQHEGTYLRWIDFRQLGLSAPELETFMLTKAKVWLNEGYTFGQGGEGFERLNLATPRARLEQGLERIEKAIKTFL